MTPRCNAGYTASMATSTLASSSTFIPAGGLQPAYVSPPDLPALADTAVAQYQAGTLVLAVAGVAATVPVPVSWTAVRAVQITNTSLTGYALLSVQGGAGVYGVLLAPQGGQFAYTHAGAEPGDTPALDPAVFTLQSCDSAAVTANGVSTTVFCYLAGV